MIHFDQCFFFFFFAGLSRPIHERKKWSVQGGIFQRLEIFLTSVEETSTKSGLNQWRWVRVCVCVCVFVSLTFDNTFVYSHPSLFVFFLFFSFFSLLTFHTGNILNQGSIE